MLAVSQKGALAAANWSASIIAVGAFTVVSYNVNHWLVIAAVIGSWTGTYLTVCRENKKEKGVSETSELLIE